MGVLSLPHAVIGFIAQKGLIISQNVDTLKAFPSLLN